jgi:cell division protein FtsB
MMVYAKREESEMSKKIDETEKLRKTSILDLENLTRTKDEYEKRFANMEAESSKLIEEIEKLRNTIENENSNSKTKEEL